MRNLVVGSNQLVNVSPMLVGQQAFDAAVITRDPVETVSPQVQLQSAACATGDITWRVAKDVMSGWLCDAGVWQIFGQ